MTCPWPWWSSDLDRSELVNFQSFLHRKLISCSMAEYNKNNNSSPHVTHHACNECGYVRVWCLTFFRITKSFSKLFLLLISSSYLQGKAHHQDAAGAQLSSPAALHTCVWSPPPDPACSSAPHPALSCRCWPDPSDASGLPCRPQTGAPRWSGSRPDPAAAPI